jgi:putative endonuclease
MFARLIFAAVAFRARHGLADAPPDYVPPNAPSSNPKADPDAEGEPPPSPEQIALAKKLRARRTGIRGETYAYWYLRSRGYVMVARNFMAPGMKGEIDIVGYDDATLAFVEVKTRSLSAPGQPRPEDAVDTEKQKNVSRIAHRFRSARRVDPSNCRFDVVAIETRQGSKPVVRLHKGVLGLAST